MQCTVPGVTDGGRSIARQRKRTRKETRENHTLCDTLGGRSSRTLHRDRRRWCREAMLASDPSEPAASSIPASCGQSRRTFQPERPEAAEEQEEDEEDEERTRRTTRGTRKDRQKGIGATDERHFFLRDSLRVSTTPRPRSRPLSTQGTTVTRDLATIVVLIRRRATRSARKSRPFPRTFPARNTIGRRTRLRFLSFALGYSRAP